MRKAAQRSRSGRNVIDARFTPPISDLVSVGLACNAAMLQAAASALPEDVGVAWAHIACTVHFDGLNVFALDSWQKWCLFWVK